MKLANILKIVAEIPVGLLVAFSLFMGIGEINSGDFSGIAHLLPAALLGLLMWLIWKRPLLAGAILVLLGLLTMGGASSAMNNSQDWYVPVLLMSLPFLLAGLLLLFVAWKIRNSQA